LQVSHTAEVLKTKVADLSAPPQEQGAQGQHRGDVTDADVRDMDTPGERKLFWRGKIRLKTIIHGKNTPFRPLLTRGRYFSLKKNEIFKACRCNVLLDEKIDILFREYGPKSFTGASTLIITIGKIKFESKVSFIWSA